MANPKPTIVFRLNLANPEALSFPYKTVLAGNETVTEAEAQVNARSSWLSTLSGGNDHGKSVENVGGNIAGKNGDLITAYGKNAYYLKKTYATGSPDALLVVVSETW